MKNATTYIAESIIKAVGVAGIEAMAMKNAIYSIWKPLAEELADEVIETCFLDDDIREEYVGAIYQRYRTRMTEDFIQEALPYVEEYVGYAWDRGREDALGYAMSGLLEIQKSSEYTEYMTAITEISVPTPGYFYGYGVTSSRIADRLWDKWTMWGRDGGEYKVKKDQESIITDLVSLTGSTKSNVQRTVKRWFSTTQGQYFDRFIVPETARLLSYEEGASLREIGKKYKEFVKAEGYWSSVSEYNSESSKIFSQVQTLHEMNVATYTIQAMLDEKTCAVCEWLNGTTWSVTEAITRVYDMLISEADEAAAINPFPGRSAPEDFEDPQESPYNLPPFHPRCRCNVISASKVTAMPQEMLARPFDAGPRPTSKLLSKVYTQYIRTPSKKEVEAMRLLGEIPGSSRSLTRAERAVAKEAWESMPLEVKKWSVRNKDNFELLAEEGAEITSRVEGNKIFMNSKFFDKKKYGPQPLQHELRHALVNREAITARGGGKAVWQELSEAAGDSKKGWRSPTHVNAMYQVNGNAGLRAATAASDEFLAMIGDYYEPGMPMDQLIDAVRSKQYGIAVSDKLGSTLVSTTASRWSAREAKSACEYWWYVMDIDNATLLSKKQMLSKLSYVPTNTQTHAIAIGNELDLRDSLRAAGIKNVHQEGDNAPFDVWVGADPAKYYAGTSKVKPTDIIEVKTIIRAKNNKITMKGEALARKRKEQRKFGKRNTRIHTIVFDERTGKMYYRDDVGAFRLSAMEEVTIEDLQRKFGGKSADLTSRVEMPEYLDALAEAEAKRKKIKGTPTVALSGLKDMKPLADGKDGVNVSYTAMWKDPSKPRTKPKKVLYKPIKGESWVAADAQPGYADLGSETFEAHIGVPPDDLVRRNIGNVDVPLAYREMMAAEVAEEMEFKNLNFAKTRLVTEKGKPVGVMSEWANAYIEQSDYSYEYARTYKAMTSEQKYEAAVYDFLIGNTDRHNDNFMRHKKTGKVLMIDQGYSFPDRHTHDGIMRPAPDADTLDGLSYWRAEASRGIGRYVEQDLDPEEVIRLRNKIAELDVQGMSERYGLSAGERQAFEYRRQALVILMDNDRTGEYMWFWYQAGEFAHPEEYGLLYIDTDNLDINMVD